MVDIGISYTEEADSGTSCLSPKTFTPQKTGWSFVGWREDRTAGAGVLESKVMADSPVTLYAVFRAGVTVTYYNNSTSASSTSGYRYYNNGSVVNPSFQLTQASSGGWTARGWSTSNQGNAGITYANGAAFTRDSNVTLYGLYQQSITVTYYNNSTSASRTTGTRYWAPAGYINPSFTLTQAGLSGWTARGWSTGTAGNSGITYNNGAAFTRDSNTTLYGMYQQTITLSYNGNGASGEVRRPRAARGTITATAPPSTRPLPCVPTAFPAAAAPLKSGRWGAPAGRSMPQGQALPCRPALPCMRYGPGCQCPSRRF